MSSSFDPFPPAYQAFFCTLEPALTIAGAGYAVFGALKYHQELIPVTIASIPDSVHPASLMGVRQLGSLFFTFYDLGLAGSLDYQNWNTLVYGNCIITATLFLVRMLWLGGVGRGRSKK